MNPKTIGLWALAVSAVGAAGWNMKRRLDGKDADRLEQRLLSHGIFIVKSGESKKGYRDVPMDDPDVKAAIADFETEAARESFLSKLLAAGFADNGKHQIQKLYDAGFKLQKSKDEGGSPTTST